MSDIFDFDCLYCLDKDQSKKITNKPKNISKMCLFADASLTIQTKHFTQLMSQLGEPIYFSLEKKSNELLWFVFASYSTLLKIRRLINDENFDYLMWPEKIIEAPKLLLFDMDSTFIQIEVIDELAKKHDVGDKVSRVTEAAMRGELDFAQSLISRVQCLKNLASSTIHQIAESLPLSLGVKDLVTAAKVNHCRIAIVSGGFSPFANQLKKDLNLYKVKANDLEIINNRLTGKVLGDIVDAQVKANFLLSLCDELSISPDQAMAIGDGANDLNMMQAAGFNLAYKAKPKVQKQAKGCINHTNLGRLAAVFGW